MQRPEKEKLPIVDEDFNLKGLITIKDIEKQIKYPLSAKDEPGTSALRRSASVLPLTAWSVPQELVNAKVDVVVMDSAHGHSANVLRTVRHG